MLVKHNDSQKYGLELFALKINPDPPTHCFSRHVTVYAPTLFSIYVCFSDIVYVGTIHSNHAELSKKMLEAGKHVLCEKPMAINWKQGKEVIDLARKKHLFFGEVRTFVLLSMTSMYDTFLGVYYMFTH